MGGWEDESGCGTGNSGKRQRPGSETWWSWVCPGRKPGNMRTRGKATGGHPVARFFIQRSITESWKRKDIWHFWDSTTKPGKLYDYGSAVYRTVRAVLWEGDAVERLPALPDWSGTPNRVENAVLKSYTWLIISDSFSNTTWTRSPSISSWQVFFYSVGT